MNDTPPEILARMVAAFGTGRVDDVRDYLAEDYLDHQGLDGQELVGPDAFANLVRLARSNYTELDVWIEDVIDGSDRAAARLVWHGTRTDGSVERRETIEIVRAEDGKAVEHWGARADG